MPSLLTSLLLMLVACRHTESFSVLGVFPHFGKSHFDVFAPYLEELVARGHDVTVISHFPRSTPLVNYSDISVAGTMPTWKPTETVRVGDVSTSRTVFAEASHLGMWGVETCQDVLEVPAIQELLRSDRRFDLIVLELFNTDCFIGFAHRFPAPVIGFSSCAIMPWTNDRFGNPDNPAYIPMVMSGFRDRMTFWERLTNTLAVTMSKAIYHLNYEPHHERIARRHFGDDMPPLRQLARTVSLLLVNTHFSLNRARPLVPAVVEVGGVHIRPLGKLPKEVEDFLSGATNGVIYFSLGSMIRAQTMPQAQLRALQQAFSELPQRVLWKWEGDMEEKPKNVMTAAWLPQSDILAHPNVRLFLSHCGLLGTIEATHFGVPIVGIPFYGDQFTNLRAAVANGVALELKFSELTVESLRNALTTVLHDPRFRENARRLAEQFRDRPLTPMDNAIFWTEYVVRHHGAPELRSAAADLPWYQLALLDVIAVLVVVLVFVVWVSWLLISVVRRRAAKSKVD